MFDDVILLYAHGPRWRRGGKNHTRAPHAHIHIQNVQTILMCMACIDKDNTYIFVHRHPREIYRNGLNSARVCEHRAHTFLIKVFERRTLGTVRIVFVAVRSRVHFFASADVFNIFPFGRVRRTGRTQSEYWGG